MFIRRICLTPLCSKNPFRSNAARIHDSPEAKESQIFGNTSSPKRRCQYSLGHQFCGTFLKKGERHDGCRFQSLLSFIMRIFLLNISRIGFVIEGITPAMVKDARNVRTTGQPTIFGKPHKSRVQPGFHHGYVLRRGDLWRKGPEENT